MMDDGMVGLKIAEMRPKMPKMRLKMAKMRLKMAKMRLKVAKMTSLVPPRCILGASLVHPWCIPGASLHPLTWSQDPFWTYFVPLAPPKGPT